MRSDLVIAHPGQGNIVIACARLQVREMIYSKFIQKLHDNVIMCLSTLCRYGPDLQRSTPVREGARLSPRNPGNLSSSHLLHLHFPPMSLPFVLALHILTGKNKDRSSEK